MQHRGKNADVVLPEEFLGGSAPLLQSLSLWGIAYRGILNLMLSTNHLVELHLFDTPHSGYVSPNAMVTCLSGMPNLKTLSIGFRSPQSRPDPSSQRFPPPTRVALPAPTNFWFNGVSEYIEDFVSLINVPQLDNLDISFFNQLIFDIPRLHDFLARTETFNSHNRAAVRFHGHAVYFNLESRLSLGISCTKSDWQISSITQICGQILPLFPALECLDIGEGTMPPPHWQDDVENTQWLELLRRFPALKDLYLDWEFAPRVSPALQEIAGERAICVLPKLENIFVEGLQSSESVGRAIRQFVAARQLSDHPVTLHRWEEWP